MANFQTKLADPARNRYLVCTIMTEWRININEDGMALVEALAHRTPAAPPGFLRQLIKKSRISINAVDASAETIVRHNEHLLVKDSGRWQEILSNSPLRPDQILYEDALCFIINKPAGLATHRGKGHDDDLISRAENHFKLRKDRFRIAPIQRLDIGTSGAILTGKGKKAAGSLGKLMMNGGISKSYLALVSGAMPERGRLDSPVRAKGHMKGALSTFHTLETTGEHSLILLELATGRQHQIRQQLAKAGHPILGDKRYGTRTERNLTRPILHCYRLTFKNPESGVNIDIRCLPGADIYQQLRACNIKWDV